MRTKLKWYSILIVALLMVTAAHSARAEDYFIEVIERPTNNQFDTANRVGRYKFRIKIHPNSSLEQIDGFGKICVADTAVFRWALGSSPQVPPLQSRTDSKTVESSVHATGDWTGQRNAYFSVALPGSECASNGLNPAGQSNRVQESARLASELNISGGPVSGGPVNAGNLPTGPTASLPPYRLKIYPAANATSGTTIRFRVEATGTGPSAFCKYEAIPTSGGTLWSNVSTNCAEVSTTLTAGTYALRLTTRVARASGGFEDLTEERRDYVVIPHPNYSIPVLATELLRLGAKYTSRSSEDPAPCDELTQLSSPPAGYTAIFGVSCPNLHRLGKKLGVETYRNFKLQNGWRIKRVEVAQENSHGSFTWDTKPEVASDHPYMFVKFWVDPHVGTLVDPNYKFIKVKVKIWIEGPSHLSPFEANKPR